MQRLTQLTMQFSFHDWSIVQAFGEMLLNGFSLIFITEAFLLILESLWQVQPLLPAAFRKVLSLLRFYFHCICFLWGQFLRNTIFHFIVMRTIPRFICPWNLIREVWTICWLVLLTWRHGCPLNFLHLNENKTEIIVFESSDAFSSSCLDFGLLSPFVKPLVKNLGVFFLIALLNLTNRLVLWSKPVFSISPS